MPSLDRLFGSLRIAATGLSSERAHINVISENIANARVTRTPEGGPYQRKTVAFQPLMLQDDGGQTYARGVRPSAVELDNSSEFVEQFEPGHPDADPNTGMVIYPNVNSLKEMTDLIAALRSYEANLAVQEGFVRTAERALRLAQSS